MMKHPVPGRRRLGSICAGQRCQGCNSQGEVSALRIMRDVVEVHYGTLSIIVDPTGATLGLWQPKKK